MIMMKSRTILIQKKENKHGYTLEIIPRWRRK